MLRPALLIAAALMLTPQPVLSQSRADPEAGTGLGPLQEGTARDHMIVAANPHATDAGAQMLAAGGSAADAAIATLLALNVVEPQSSGIGGGAFALVHDGIGITSFDARETAPMSATPDLFFVDGQKLGFVDAVLSGRSIGAPGLMRLIGTLHERYGVLPWADLFQPAIKLARDGFAVSPRLEGLLAGAEERLSGTDVATIFFRDGAPMTAGMLLTQPALAETLATLARDGADAFYEGPIAEAIAARVATPPIPGALTTDDLAAYDVVERRAACAPYRGYSVCGMGPPSSGATTVGQILMLLEASAGANPADTSLLWHRFAEASRLAYADRATYLADSDFVAVPVRGLLNRAYMQDRARMISRDAAMAHPAEAGDPPWREGNLGADLGPGTPGTTHVSVIDGDGLALSITASIETAFGSHRMAAGFLLNNQLTDFSFTPEAEDGTPVANAPDGGKRPRSSMSPTIVMKDGAPAILTGSPGGSRIPEYVAQSLVGMIDLGLSPGEAAALPHISQRNRAKTAVEPAFDPVAVAELEELGHEIEVRDMTSGVHTIRIMHDGTLIGGADPRREGTVSAAR